LKVKFVSRVLRSQAPFSGRNPGIKWLRRITQAYHSERYLTIILSPCSVMQHKHNKETLQPTGILMVVI
jgi:hypothetical protein